MRTTLLAKHEHTLCGLRPRLSTFRFAIYMLLAVTTASAAASAASWEDTIAKVEKRAEEYHAKASALGFPTHAGTMFNELDIPAHQCSILGRMLGKDKLIVHLEKDYPTSSQDGSEFRYAAISLDNWAHTASRLLKLNEGRRIQSWNLDCVGQHRIPTSGYIQTSASSTFFDRDGKVLRILGDVGAGFAGKLNSAIQMNPGIEYVALGSGGGSVGEALVAGRLIRAHKLETTLWNNCYSACSLVFLGGTKRTIWSPYPKLGFHMISIERVAVPPDHLAYVEVAKFAREMGIAAPFLIKAMLSASPNDMHYLTQDQMCESGIATWIQRSCWQN